MTMRLLDQPAAQGQRSSKDYIESFQPLTSGMVNVFSARWIPDSAAVELLNNNGIDPTRPAKRDGYKEIRQTTTGIRASLLDNRASGLGYLSPSLGTKLLVMAIPDAGNGGVFYTPDPDLVPWSEAGVGGSLYSLVSVKLYPASVADDLSPLSGTLPSGTSTATEGFLNLALTESAPGATTRNIEASNGSHVAVHAYTSQSGFPGVTSFWNDATHTLTVKMTNLTPSTGGSLLTSARLLPRFHRTNSSGAGQERIKALGVSLGDPTTCTAPGGGAGTLTGTGVDLVAGGLGTYTFVWAETSAMFGNSGAAIASTDSPTLELIFTFITTGGGATIMQYEIDSTNTAYTTPLEESVDDTVGWDPLIDDVKMFQANDRLWILPNPDILLAMIDNTGFLALSGTANEDAPDGIVDGVYFLNRVWLIDEHNKLYWSMLLPVSPIGSFDRATDSLTFSPNRGSRIVAIRPWQTSVLLLFFNDSVEQMIVNNADVLGGSTRELIEPDFGCCSRDGVRAVGDDFYFIDQYMQVRSLAQTEQQKTTGVVKEPLSHTIREEIPGRVNPAFKHRMRLHTEGDELHAYFPRDGSEQCDYRAIYSMTYEKWVSIDRLADGVAKILRSDIRGEWETYLLDGDDSPAEPLVAITDQGTIDDNGAGIEFSLTSKALTFEAAEAMKVPHVVALEWFGSVGATPIVEVRIDEAGSWVALTKLAGDDQVGSFGASAFPLLPGDFPLLPADFPLVSDANTSALAWARYRMDSDVIGRFRSAQIRVRQAAEGSEGVEFQVIAWHFTAQPGSMEPLNG